MAPTSVDLERYGAVPIHWPEKGTWMLTRVYLQKDVSYLITHPHYYPPQHPGVTLSLRLEKWEQPFV